MPEQVLTKSTLSLMLKLSEKSWLKKYYLAGGTGLALQYGHRQSRDLDFFTPLSINTKVLLKQLSQLGKFDLRNEAEDTVEGIVDGVKISFMSYPYGLIGKKIKWKKNLIIADKSDIAVMKFSAIGGRNSKKDFIDLYYYMKQEIMNLEDLDKLAKKKFKGIHFDSYYIYKSLVYFEEADSEPMPKMLAPVNWIEIKRFFVRQARVLLN